MNQLAYLIFIECIMNKSFGEYYEYIIKRLLMIYHFTLIFIGFLMH